MEWFQLHENSCEMYKKSEKKSEKKHVQSVQNRKQIFGFLVAAVVVLQLHIRHFKHVTFFEPRMATESALFSC